MSEMPYAPALAGNAAPDAAWHVHFAGLSWAHEINLPAWLLLKQALKGVLRLRQVARGIEHVHRIMRVHASPVRAGQLSMRGCQGVSSL